MKFWAFGYGFAIILAVSLSQQPRRDECPGSRPLRLIPAITPVVGQSPLWLTAPRLPLAWEGRDRAVELLVVRDRSVTGPAFVTGRNRATGAKVRFGKYGSTLGVREERFQLDQLGAKPKNATPADLTRYSFHMTEGWFPEAGCYEITARVGRQQSTIYLKVEQRSGK